MRLLVAARGIVVADFLRSTLGTLNGVQMTTAARLFSALSSNRPDLLIFDDTSLGSITALTLCRDTRRADLALPILYVSSKNAPADEIRALEAGADNYLSYPCPGDLATAKVRALLRRKDPKPSDLLSYEDVELNTISRSARRGERVIQLTATEYALLCLFLNNPERVLTRDSLIETIWGYDYSGNYGVLDVYICYLRGKLEAGGESRLIQTVRGTGYVLRPLALSQSEPASSEPRRSRSTPGR